LFGSFLKTMAKFLGLIRWLATLNGLPPKMHRLAQREIELTLL
jgi:hypothetical protein